MKMNMTEPCVQCPFRSDIDAFLTAGRVDEICSDLIDQQQSFPCHKTTVEDEDCDEGSMMTTDDSEHCAGAMIMLEKMERPNQMMRISERFGGYDRMKLKMDSPVFDNPEEMEDAQPR